MFFHVRNNTVVVMSHDRDLNLHDLSGIHDIRDQRALDFHISVFKAGQLGRVKRLFARTLGQLFCAGSRFFSVHLQLLHRRLDPLGRVGVEISYKIHGRQYRNGQGDNYTHANQDIGQDRRFFSAFTRF